MNKDIYAYIESLNEFKFDYSLGRVKKVLKRLGNPQDSFSVIHITGSNGKGSVAAYLAGALAANGIRTGMYTSPHLKDMRERIMIDGKMAGMEVFVEQARRAAAAVKKLGTFLTYFEFLTVTAFLVFQKEKVRTAVVEVGLGGRFDATNVHYKNKLLSIITSISLEHTGILGDTTAKILAEKEQIIGSSMAVCNVHEKKLAAHLKSAFGSRVIIPDRSYETVSIARKGAGITVVFRDICGGETIKISTAMAEPVQAENLKTVLCAFDILKTKGVRLAPEVTEAAVEKVALPGRMSRLKNGAYLSVAHNPAAVREAVRAVKFMHPGKNIIYVYTAMKDKDMSGIFAELKKAGGITLVLTTVMNERACGIKTLEHEASAAGLEFFVRPRPKDALALARKIKNRGVILIGGSFYLVNKFS